MGCGHSKVHMAVAYEASADDGVDGGPPAHLMNVKRLCQSSRRLSSATTWSQSPRIASRTPSNILSIDKFHVIGYLGKGGCGRVLLARPLWPSAPEFVAIKMVPVDDASHTEFLGKEAAIMAKLNSSQLPHLHHCFRDQRYAYLVMDYAPYGDLHSYSLKSRDRTVPENVCRYFMAHLVLQLGYLHGKGIVHRDVKCSNILISGEMRPLLVDFGISQELDLQNPVSSSKSGSMAFMAPEQFTTSHKHSFPVDWFALGIVMFTLLHGARPYPSSREIMRWLLRKAVNTPPPAARSEEQEWYLLQQQTSCPAAVRTFRPSSRVSSDAQDLYKKLLIPHPRYRLGAEGVQEIMAHPWFHGVDWHAVRAGRAEPPVSLRDTLLFQHGALKRLPDPLEADFGAPQPWNARVMDASLDYNDRIPSTTAPASKRLPASSFSSSTQEMQGNVVGSVSSKPPVKAVRLRGYRNSIVSHSDEDSVVDTKDYATKSLALGPQTRKAAEDLVLPGQPSPPG